MPAGGDGPKGTVPYQRRRDGWGEGGDERGWGKRGGGVPALSHAGSCAFAKDWLL